MNFTAFVDWLGVELTPAQRVLCKVAFDGIDPIDLDAEDHALAVRLFGPVDRIPASARKVLVAVCGARGGKTYVLIALRLLHLALTVDLSHLAPGELAAAVVVAPDMKLARQAIRYVRGAVEAKAELRALVSPDADSADGFVIDRGNGRRVSIECLAAARGGSATRGRSLVGAALDECAFFRDSNAVINDIDVYRSVAARVMPGGQVVIASTPWAESGLLYDLYTDNHGKPSTALACHAPTSLLREGHQHILDEVERERSRDPESTAREFDAEFLPSGTGQFFDRASIEAAMALDLPDEPCNATGAGMDPGFRSDSSALAIAKRYGDVIDVPTVDEMRPAKGSPLVPAEVCARFAGLMNTAEADSVASDGHYIESVREHMTEHQIGVIDAPPGQQGKAQVYLRFRELLRSGKVRLPQNKRLLDQLLSIVSKPLPGGGMSITAPRTRSGHGDLVSALVLAVWRADQFSGPRTTSGGSRRYGAFRNGPPRPRSTFDPVSYLKQRAEERRRVLSGQGKRPTGSRRF